MALQPEALIVSNIGETMSAFGSAVAQLAEAVKELNSQQQQQQQQHEQKMLEQQERQQQHHFLLQKLAEEHHLQLLQQQQQLVPPRTLPQVSSDYVPPAIEARLLLMEEVSCLNFGALYREICLGAIHALLPCRPCP
jgi:Sec-independent protein translocase protein TatA